MLPNTKSKEYGILYKFKLAEGDHERQIALDRIHSANISSAVLPIHLAEKRYIL